MNQLNVVLVLLLTGSFALAENSESLNSQDTSNKTPLREVLRQKKFADDSDITDTKMKADEGSRSEYSVKFSLTYSGPPIGDLNNPKQPNPDGSIGTYDTRIGGAISGRFRLNPQSAISLGSGATALQPLQGVTRYDVNNPFIAYDISGKWNGLQVRNYFSVVDATNPDFMAVGETGGAGYVNYAVYNIPNSKFAVELDTGFSYWVYNRGYIRTDKTAGQYFISLTPFVKYLATDKLNFNTSWFVQYMNPRSSTDSSVLNNKTVTEQMAMGYSISKDVYISPYINFYPASLTAASTTINVSTTFSLL